jgi:hypothetical protein
MTGGSLVAAVLLGVLVPAVFARPEFLRTHRMRGHIRRRWDYFYTWGAFVGIGYAYVSSIYLLRPIHAFSMSERRVLYGGGLILLVIASLNHIPPLLAHRRASRPTQISIAACPGLGLVAGAFGAIDEVFPHASEPLLAIASWLMLTLLLAVGAVTFSGLSPETRLALSARRKRKRLRASDPVPRPGG